MERHFEKDLNEMKERLLWMGSLAERAVHQSVQAVLESDEQLAKDCALPGGYLSGAFDKGWATILGRLASAAEEAGK